MTADFVQEAAYSASNSLSDRVPPRLKSDLSPPFLGKLREMVPVSCFELHISQNIALDASNLRIQCSQIASLKVIGFRRHPRFCRYVESKFKAAIESVKGKIDLSESRKQVENKPPVETFTVQSHLPNLAKKGNDAKTKMHFIMTVNPLKMLFFKNFLPINPKMCVHVQCSHTAYHMEIKFFIDVCLKTQFVCISRPQ